MYSDRQCLLCSRGFVIFRYVEYKFYNKYKDGTAQRLLGDKRSSRCWSRGKTFTGEQTIKKKKNSGGIKSKKAKCEDSKRSIKSDIAAFEKKHKDEPKGTSFFWKSTIEIVQGLVVNLYLTCIVDSKFC